MKVRDFRSDEEVAALVAAFEAGGLAPSAFTHAAHLAVGLAYLAAGPPERAAARMRHALRAFTRRHGLTTVYHETLTAFWMRLLAHLAAGRFADLPLWARVNRVVDEYGSWRPVEAHYSPDVLASPAAREGWVEPDRLPLPF